MIVTSCYRPKKSLPLIVIPKNFWYYPPPPLNLAGLWGSRKISATTPPPLNLAPAYGIPKKFCCYPPPPPLNLAPAYGDPEKFLLLPPPTESGRPAEIMEKWPPPKQKSWLRRCSCGEVRVLFETVIALFT